MVQSRLLWQTSASIQAMSGKHLAKQGHLENEDKAAAMIFEGAAQLYDRLAIDIEHEGQERGSLDEFFLTK
jgi:hypothetical protein